MWRNYRMLLALAAAVVLPQIGNAENRCGTSADTLQAINTAQVYTWQGKSLQGNPSTSAGIFLTPFATGPIDAIVAFHLRLPTTGANVPLLLAISDGRGNVFFAEEKQTFFFSGATTQVWDHTMRVTSPQLYVALWAESGGPLHYFTGTTKLKLQPRVCDPGQYRAKFDIDSTSDGTNDGTIELTWEIPSTVAIVPPAPTCTRLDKTCRGQFDKWYQFWRLEN